jgi:hypothetical protein
MGEDVTFVAKVGAVAITMLLALLAVYATLPRHFLPLPFLD